MNRVSVERDTVPKMRPEVYGAGFVMRHPGDPRGYVGRGFCVLGHWPAWAWVSVRRAGPQGHDGAARGGRNVR